VNSGDLDKQTVINLAAIGAATVVTCAGLVAFCFQPSQGAVIATIVGPIVTLCGTIWQAQRRAGDAGGGQ
jgi:hypothetical protein